MRIALRNHLTSLKSLKLRSAIGEKGPEEGGSSNLLINGTFDDDSGWTMTEGAAILDGIAMLRPDVYEIASITHALTNEELPVGSVLRVSGTVVEMEGTPETFLAGLMEPDETWRGGVPIDATGSGPFTTDIVVTDPSIAGDTPLPAGSLFIIGIGVGDQTAVVVLDNITVEIVG